MVVHLRVGMRNSQVGIAYGLLRIVSHAFVFAINKVIWICVQKVKWAHNLRILCLGLRCRGACMRQTEFYLVIGQRWKARLMSQMFMLWTQDAFGGVA